MGRGDQGGWGRDAVVWDDGVVREWVGGIKDKGVMRTWRWCWCWSLSSVEQRRHFCFYDSTSILTLDFQDEDLCLDGCSGCRAGAERRWACHVPAGRGGWEGLWHDLCESTGMSAIMTMMMTARLTSTTQSSNSPVADVTSASMVCNTNGGTPVAGICDAKGTPPPQSQDQTSN